MSQTLSLELLNAASEECLSTLPIQTSMDYSLRLTMIEKVGFLSESDSQNVMNNNYCLLPLSALKSVKYLASFCFARLQ